MILDALSQNPVPILILQCKSGCHRADTSGRTMVGVCNSLRVGGRHMLNARLFSQTEHDNLNSMVEQAYDFLRYAPQCPFRDTSLLSITDQYAFGDCRHDDRAMFHLVELWIYMREYSHYHAG